MGQGGGTIFFQRRGGGIFFIGAEFLPREKGWKKVNKDLGHLWLGYIRIMH